MFSSSDYKHRSDRDSRRTKTRWDAPSGAQTRPVGFSAFSGPSASGFNPPPQGLHTRFDDPMDVDVDNREFRQNSSNKRSRERSRERDSHETPRFRLSRGPEQQKDARRSVEASKRPKREHNEGDDLAIPGNFSAHFDRADSFDELDSLTSHPPDRNQSHTPIVDPNGASQADGKPDRRTSGLIGFVKGLISKPEPAHENIQVENSSQYQDALEAVVQAQSESKYLSDQLKAALDKCKELEEKVAALEAKGKSAPGEIQRIKLEGERERTELVNQASKDTKYIEQANAHIHDLTQKQQQHLDVVKRYEDRIRTLIHEKGQYSSQLKQYKALLDTRASALPDTRAPKTAGEISLDPFDNTLDQISEAAVKSGVESLNDSLVDFTMDLLEDVDTLAAKNSGSSAAPDQYVTEFDANNPLHAGLDQHRDVDDKRGFFLDAEVHQLVVTQLDKLFFSGDTVSRALDSRSMFSFTFQELAKTEPWAAVQRWRALTASVTHLKNVPVSYWKDSITRCCESITMTLSFAFRQPHKIFEPLLSKMQKRLEAIYTEADQLSLSIRRDVLSVRMSAIIAPKSSKGDFLPYNSDNVACAWPDMKPVNGDEVIGLYKLGLQKINERGQSKCIIKPEVVTTALLREMAKN